MGMEETAAMTRSVTRSSIRSTSFSLEDWSNRHVTRSLLLEGSFCSSLLQSPKAKKNVGFKKGGPGLRTPGGRHDLSTSCASDEGVGSDLGSSSRRHWNLLPDIPPMLARPRHPLKQAWTLWYYRNDRCLSWEANQLEVATVTTIEEFWQLHQLLQPASRLGQGTDYAMFRAGVLPDWEDPANRNGGRWIARRDHSNLDTSWLELLFFLLGEHADTQAGHVTGVVASVRKKGGKVAVWLRDARAMVAVVDVGRQIRARLALGKEEKIKFSVHQEAKDRAEGKEAEKLADILM